MVRNSSVSFDMVVFNKGVEHEAVALASLCLRRLFLLHSDFSCDYHPLPLSSRLLCSIFYNIYDFPLQ